jgi:hypothetical protein
MKIYVVIAIQGEWNAREEWPVKAFISEEKAKEFIEKKTALIKQAVIDYNEADNAYWQNKIDCFKLEQRRLKIGLSVDIDNINLAADTTELRYDEIELIE